MRIVAIVDIDSFVRVKISPRKYILSNLSKSSATANFCGVIDSTPKDSSQSLLSCLITYFVIIGLFISEIYCIRSICYHNYSIKQF